MGAPSLGAGSCFILLSKPVECLVRASPLLSPSSPSVAATAPTRQSDDPDSGASAIRTSQLTLLPGSKKEKKNAKDSGGIAAAVTKQTAGKFA